MPFSGDPAALFQSVQESMSAVSRSKATASYAGMIGQGLAAIGVAGESLARRSAYCKQPKQPGLCVVPLAGKATAGMHHHV